MPKNEGWGTPAPISFFEGATLDIAQHLLSCMVVSTVDDEPVVLRITEVEAYLGVGEDPGSHAFRGRTQRNASMFLGGGHLYVYRAYGIHWCANLVPGPEGEAGGILLRAGEVIEGVEAATRRRTATGVVQAPRDLARGPGRLSAALGITGAHDGTPVTGGGEIAVWLPNGPLASRGRKVGLSTRTGVSGPGARHRFRYFLENDPTVSAHRPVRQESSPKPSSN